MAKKIDRIVLTIVLLVFNFLWLQILTKNIAITAILACLTTFLIAFVIWQIGSHVESSPYSERELAEEFAIRGNSYALTIFALALQNENFELKGNVLASEKTAIVANFKLGDLSLSDVLNCYQQNKNKQTIIILTNSISAGCLQFARRFNSEIEIVSMKNIFKFLKAKNALPVIEKRKSTFSFKDFFSIFFKQKNAKYFLLTSIPLLIFSFLTPMKIYYIIMSAVAICFAIVSMLPFAHDNSGDGTNFNKLTKQALPKKKIKDFFSSNDENLNLRIQNADVENHNEKKK